MKKFFIYFVALGITSLVACGPSEEERAAADAEAREQADQAMEALEETMTPDEAAESLEEATDEIADSVATENNDATMTEGDGTNNNQ